MALYGPPTATATVAANTNSVTITGMDLSLITPGMTINLGARGRKTGDAFIISAVAPSGSNGGTVTTQESIPAAYNSQPFVIDTTGYLGTDASYAAAVGLAILSTLSTLLGVATNLYSGARQLVLDKVNAAAVSRIMYSIGGRAWAAIEHRSFTFTPTGGQATSIETLAVRAAPDGTIWSDALLLDLANGTGDLRAGSVTMAAGSMVDLGSAPVKKVSVTGGASISSFGPGRHLERLVRFVDSGASLVHNATSLDLPGGANILVRAGDRALATSDGSGNWRVLLYQRADGGLIRFTPVQQGTGPGQLASNTIKIGWSGQDLLAAVDTTALGKIWSDWNSSSSFASAGYVRLQNGFFIQWASPAGPNADFVTSFPLTFPNACLAVVPAIANSDGAAAVINFDQISKSGCAIRTRKITSGSVASVTGQTVNYIAIGY